MNRLFASAAAALFLASPFVPQAAAQDITASTQAFSVTEDVAEDDDESGLTLTLIPRVDASFNSWKTNDGSTYLNNRGIEKAVRIPGNNWGNTIGYAILDGSITDNLSVYGCFHLFAPDPSWLYANTFRSDECSWLDMLSLTYSLGDFDISLGKENLAFGGFEQDADICDPYLDLCTNSWHSIQSFLWGGRVAYNFGEEQNVFFQGLASPFSEYPFQDKLFSAAVGWNGSIGTDETMWSFGVIRTGDENDGCSNLMHLSLGNRLTFGNFSTTLDLGFRAFSLKSLFNEEMSSLLDVRYSFDKFDVFAKGGWEFCHKSFNDGCNYFGDAEAAWEYEELPGDICVEGTIVPMSIFTDKDYLFGGIGIEYYPLASRNLKIHLVGAANNCNNARSITVGATYYFGINLK